MYESVFGQIILGRLFTKKILSDIPRRDGKRQDKEHRIIQRQCNASEYCRVLLS